MTEFDRDCEIGMLEENVHPLRSDLQAQIKGALVSILWHKIAGLNILIGASKFLVHQFEDGLLNRRQLKNVIYDDLENPFPPKKDLGIKDLKLSLELLKPWLLCKVLRSKIFTEISSHQVLLEETPKSFLAATPHNFIAKVNLMDGGGCTALDISDDLSQAGKTEMKIKATQRLWGAFGAKYDQMRKIFKWGRLSLHLQNTWLNIKIKNKSKSYVFHLLLLLALLSTIMFHAALKIMGCRSEKGFQQISSLNPFCRVVNKHPHLFQLLITLNSAAFFLCLAFMTFSLMSFRSSHCC